MIKGLPWRYSWINLELQQDQTRTTSFVFQLLAHGCVFNVFLSYILVRFFCMFGCFSSDQWIDICFYFLHLQYFQTCLYTILAYKHIGLSQVL